MHKGILRLGDQSDLEILKFLWRWKTSSTAGIALAVLPNRSMNKVYRRLLALERAGYIRVQASANGKGAIWLLDAKGFHLVKGLLPRLTQAGFKSEYIGHDLLVHAVHLGDWVAGVPHGCDLYTEQELRRIEFDFYPSWVPRTPSHRPDGWWLVSSGAQPAVVALEVELSLKDPADYQTVGEFYSERIRIERTIWVVRGETDARYIHRHLTSGHGQDVDRHSVLYLTDFMRHGWQSPIRLGKDQGRMLQDLLGTMPVPSGSHGTGMVLLDVRKKPVRLRSPESPSITVFLN